MLGSLSEADDAVQDAWLRLSRADISSVQNLGGWLTTWSSCILPGPGRTTVAALDDGKRSRVTISCEFQGHGIGKLLVPLLARRLAKQLPRDEQKLKELLERGAYAQT